MCVGGLREELRAEGADLGRGEAGGEEAVETLGFLSLEPLVVRFLGRYGRGLRGCGIGGCGFSF